MQTKDSNFQRWPHLWWQSTLLLLVSCVGLHLILIPLEWKTSGTDVFLFKEAGTRLATEGQFVVKNILHMPWDEDVAYAYYPPLYPFLFGLWSKCFGIGLTQSLSFDAALRILRTLLLLALLFPFIQTNWKQRRHIKNLLVFTLLTGISVLSTDTDRPDELALVFGLASWVVLTLFRSNPFTTLLIGVLLGSAGAASPAGGVLFALGTCFYLRKEKQRLIFIGFLAALCFAATVLPIYLSDPLAYQRFVKQVPLSTFPYLTEIYNKQYSLWDHWAFAIKVAPQYWFCAIVLSVILLITHLKQKKPPHPFACAALLYIGLNVVVWTLQPYYTWFVSLVLLALLLKNNVGVMPKSLALGITVAFAPLLILEAKNVSHATQRSPQQRTEYIKNQVLSRIGNGRLAVTPDQYFTFRNNKKVEFIHYNCKNLYKYDFVYVTPKSRHIQRRPLAPVSCGRQAWCFQPIADLTTNRRLVFLGKKTPFYVSGNDGVLYQNTRCPRFRYQIQN